MLSQDDRRQLETIARYLQDEDPAFAQGLRDGKPAKPLGDRRWPIVASGGVAMVVFLIALVTAAVLFLFLGVVGVVSAVVAYRRQVRRAHGRPLRGRWKAKRPER